MGASEGARRYHSNTATAEPAGWGMVRVKEDYTQFYNRYYRVYRRFDSISADEMAKACREHAERWQSKRRDPSGYYTAAPWPAECSRAGVPAPGER